MAKFLGRLVDFGIKKESVRGTAETSALYWIPKVTLSFDDQIEQVIDEASTGVLEDANDAKITKQVAVGSLETKVGSKTVGLFLLALFGTDTPSGPTDSAYTHTFSVAQNSQHQALSLFINDGNQDYKHPLGMITDFTLTVGLGAFAMFSVGLRSKIGATTSNTPSYIAETNFLPKHATFKIAATQSALTGASATNIRMLKLKFDKNVEDDMALGSNDPADILNKEFSIEGELEYVFNANTEKLNMLGDTVQALRITLNNTDVLIGVSSTNQLQVDLHAVKFSEFKRNYANKDITTASVKFKAFYKAADSKMVTCTLINDVASY